MNLLVGGKSSNGIGGVTSALDLSKLRGFAFAAALVATTKMKRKCDDGNV